ncbi:50S ribosomal protein L9 [Marinoscillum furvescens]|uniref:Large ribosomal subunit protein bL9 n=1 Tax=Marinoscillum furvescens DSM 4134 TaxID=1122208 RepID=A0A3D9L0C5_MARFU|nr:50S ribosomal protein L9 [Marinoscillum furvescens]RED96194.1 LSU ribosomal protein L9P [Marinoscillum furvescens DSM 4134]
MDIILKEDIKGLGYKNDVVAVKPGYGRNYLIPQGMAIIASESNKKMIAENVRQAAHKAEKIKNDAEDLAKKIGDLTLEIKTKAGESGKIFGAVTALQIADALSAKGFDIDRKKITIVGSIKETGEHKAVLDLHKAVHHEITLNVVPE